MCYLPQDGFGDTWGTVWDELQAKLYWSPEFHTPFIRVGRSHWHFASPGIDISSMSNITKLINYSLFPSVQFSLKKKSIGFLGEDLEKKNKKCLVYTGVLPQEELRSFLFKGFWVYKLAQAQELIDSVFMIHVGALLSWPWFFGFYRLSMNLVAILSTFKNTVIS